MNKDIIQIIFANQNNHKIVHFEHETYANRKFCGNKIEEIFWFNLSKEEIKELCEKLSAAAGV